MGYISDLYNYNDTESEKQAAEMLDPTRQKQILSVIEDIVSDEFDRLAERAGEYLSELAARRAGAFLNRVLRGDPEAGRQLLSEDGRDRYDHRNKPWSQLIHGRLFETSSVELRRQIVEAHADLLRTERIADLESTVEGLTQQIQDLEQEVERWRQR